MKKVSNAQTERELLRILFRIRNDLEQFEDITQVKYTRIKYNEYELFYMVNYKSKEGNWEPWRSVSAIYKLNDEETK